jgi:hypothetical protein
VVAAWAGLQAKRLWPARPVLPAPPQGTIDLSERAVVRAPRTGWPPGARLFSAAALVEALPGQEHAATAADGTYRVVLPAVVVSRERVPQNEAFELDDLAPGRYVILAQYAGGDVSTYVDVSVAPGQVVMVVLPDTCK